MNRKQRVKMIVRALLMPFTRDPFGGRDLLRERAQAYRELRNHNGLYGDLVRRNERTRKALHHSLAEEVEPDRLSELGELIEMFYPASDLADQLDTAVDSGLEGYYFAVLLRLSTEMITLRDGRVSIKMWETPGGKEYFPDSSGLYKVELWSEISRVITPDVLIAGYFVQCGIEDVQYLRNLPDNIFLSDTIFSRISRKGLAETHLHLNAGMSYQSVWEAVTDPSAQRLTARTGISAYQKRQRREQKFHSKLMIAGWLRLIMSKYLETVRGTESEKEIDISQFYLQDAWLSDDALERKVLDFVLHGSGEEDMAALLSEITKTNNCCTAILKEQFGVTSRTGEMDVLLRGPYRRYQGLQTAPELLLLFFSLEHVRRVPRHEGFQRVLLCYLRIKNEYFSHKVQSMGMSGLTFFREYFAEAMTALSVRQGEDAQKRKLAYQAAFRNQLHCMDLVKLEVKLSPPTPVGEGPEGRPGDYRVAIASQLRELFEAYRAVLKDTRMDQDSPEHTPTLGVVYHLIRENTHLMPGDACWLERTLSGRGDVVSTIRRQSMSFVEGLQYLLRKTPYLSEYVVGLDVASEELYTEPWVYAPVYHKVRNRYSTYPIQLDTGRLMQNIGFTYHVGEDYYHVISGLRHIDEVLTHFGYKAGDRLGHGMALQVDLAEWVHNNEVVSIPAIEHLENLLWLWSLCNEDSKNLLEYLPGLEREIMGLAAELYCNIKGLTPYVLWTAYRRKFKQLDEEFCEQMEQLYLQPQEDEEQVSVHWQYPFQRSFCARVWQGEPECRLPGGDNVWDAGKLLLTHYCPAYERTYQKPRFVSIGPDKLPLYQAVQTYMCHKVQNMGVYIETNPTSNLLIGDVRSLQEYHIENLNDHLLRETTSAAVLISVNSDDPLLFNTNIENELALVYHMLLYRGMGREQVIDWIDKVRQYGLDSSFVRTTKSRQSQMKELDQIIQQLARLRKELIEGGEG